MSARPRMHLWHGHCIGRPDECASQNRHGACAGPLVAMPSLAPSEAGCTPVAGMRRVCERPERGAAVETRVLACEHGPGEGARSRGCVCVLLRCRLLQQMPCSGPGLRPVRCLAAVAGTRFDVAAGAHLDGVAGPQQEQHARRKGAKLRTARVCAGAKRADGASKEKRRTQRSGVLRAACR